LRHTESFIPRGDAERLAATRFELCEAFVDLRKALIYTDFQVGHPAFHAIQASFNAVKPSLNAVKASFDTVEARVDCVKTRANRVSKIEKSVEDLTGRRLFAHKGDTRLRVLPETFLEMAMTHTL
jgi:hypothetical protein